MNASRPMQLALFLCGSTLLAAEPAYFVTPVSNLKFLDKSPTAEQQKLLIEHFRTEASTVALEGGAESLLFDSATFRNRNRNPAADRVTWNEFDGICLVVRGPSGQQCQGRLFVRKGDDAGAFAFTVSLPEKSADSHRLAFWQVWDAHYQQQLAQQSPGAAWYRHQVRRADDALGRKHAGSRRGRNFFGRRSNNLDDTFALMSGGQALSENLQLDRELPDAGDGVESVSVASIEGITVGSFDWGPLNEGKKIQVDPLARLVPADQHVVLVPSFRALVALADTADKNGAPILQLGDPQAVNAMSRERYERQLGLQLNTAARMLGPELIRSVAVTGGDAYLRTGSDIAVLFETPSALALKKLIETQVALVAKGCETAAPIRGEVNGVSFTGYRSPDRVICSMIAEVDGKIVVTNSLKQLEQIVRTSRKEIESIADEPEYTFFRHRYAREESGESALVIISDKTIRRWCGPKWRIGASRRTRVAASLAELQAEHLSELVGQEVEGRREIAADFALGRNQQFVLASDGVSSPNYGSLQFLTPIIEMDVAMATPEEARLYRRWRDGYQQNWSRYFDPIAVSVHATEEKLTADVTVMPLIDNSRYGQWMQLSRGAALKGALGDPHPEALLHWAMALNTESALLKSYTNLLQAFAPQIRVDPLSWVGEAVAVYVDRDPIWKKAAEAENPERYLEEHGHHAPLAVHVEVKSALKMTLFLSGLRAFIEQTAPGLTAWETHEHNGEPYVKIGATERAISDAREKDYALYYAASSDGLTLSLNEDLIKRTLDRRKARRGADKADGPKVGEENANSPGAENLAAWNGENLALRVSKEGAELFQTVFRDSNRRRMQQMSWSNLEILNEWKRLFPDADPADIHEMFWHRRPICPGGGDYVWNAELGTMVSTVYGCPAKPLSGPALPAALREFSHGEFGVTFAEHGLRSKMQLNRKKAE